MKARIVRRRNIIAVDDDSLVSERIFTFFKEQFLSGELRPGDTLLPERELAQRLGVSRPTLREVMRAMALLGVIEIRRGQKAVVAAPSADVLQNFFGILLWMRPSIYQHILEARIAVECQAVRLACVNAQAVDIEGLRLALARIQDTASDADAGAEADFDFHTLIVLASHNEVLRFIHEAVATLLRKSHRERRQQVSGQSEFLATLGDAHRQLLNAIVARDPDAAETAVRQHFYIAQEHERRKSVQQAGFAPSKTSGKRANGR